MWDIVRWDPVRDLAAMREVDRVMGRPFGAGGAASAPWSPASDVYETEDAIVITAELPGVKDEDVEITVRDGVLAIGGSAGSRTRWTPAAITGSSAPTAASSGASASPRA